MNKPRKVIVLTDPGQDQAAAILLMLGAPEYFDIQGFVATAGNIDIKQTTTNILKLLELTEYTHIPVYSGSTKPICRELIMAEHVHGPSGLDGYELPTPKITPQHQHGVDFIIDCIKSNQKEGITICSLSPLTNLALAIAKAPEITSGISEVIAMAGAYFEVGNITPTAEFNIYVDPEAAKIVLSSGMSVTMLPLDVTHQMLTTQDRIHAMRDTGTQAGKALAGMLKYSEAFDIKKYGWNGAPLHGPCVPVWIMAPSSFESRLVNVRIETGSDLTLGMSVVDWWQITSHPKNVRYIRNGDSDILYKLINESLLRLP